MRLGHSNLFLTVSDGVVLSDECLDGLDLLFLLMRSVTKLDIFQQSCLHPGFLLSESLFHVHTIMLAFLLDLSVDLGGSAQG